MPTCPRRKPEKFFLLSGEGVTDMGAGKGQSGVHQGEDFFPGPMAIIVDHVIQPSYDFSILDVGCCGYVSEKEVGRQSGELKAAKKSLRLPGKRRAKETRYFFNHARLLARIAKDQGNQRQDDVVAVLFRDSDGTTSAGRGLWEDKWQSVVDGFDEERFARGVPMIPKPKSEAWLICALKKDAYQNCQALEDRSGNDKSPNSLKAQLKELLGEEITPQLLSDAARTRLDIEKIKMPSFQAFQDRLKAVLQQPDSLTAGCLQEERPTPQPKRGASKKSRRRRSGEQQAE